MCSTFGSIGRTNLLGFLTANCSFRRSLLITRDGRRFHVTLGHLSAREAIEAFKGYLSPSEVGIPSLLLVEAPS
jgi:hypothetical protein